MKYAVPLCILQKKTLHFLQVSLGNAKEISNFAVKHKEVNENRVYNINTSQTPDDVIEMKANQVYGVSDALHGHGEIVMEKNIVYGGHKEDYTENTEYD